MNAATAADVVKANRPTAGSATSARGRHPQGAPASRPGTAAHRHLIATAGTVDEGAAPSSGTYHLQHHHAPASPRALATFVAVPPPEKPFFKSVADELSARRRRRHERDDWLRTQPSFPVGTSRNLPQEQHVAAPPSRPATTATSTRRDQPRRTNSTSGRHRVDGGEAEGANTIRASRPSVCASPLSQLPPLDHHDTIIPLCDAAAVNCATVSAPYESPRSLLAANTTHRGGDKIGDVSRGVCGAAWRPPATGTRTAASPSPSHATACVKPRAPGSDQRASIARHWRDGCQPMVGTSTKLVAWATHGSVHHRPPFTMPATWRPLEDIAAAGPSVPNTPAKAHRRLVAEALENRVPRHSGVSPLEVPASLPGASRTLQSSPDDLQDDVAGATDSKIPGSPTGTGGSGGGQVPPAKDYPIVRAIFQLSIISNLVAFQAIRAMGEASLVSQLNDQRRVRGNRRLNKAEFFHSLCELLKFRVDRVESDLLFETFDDNGSGGVDEDEFIAGVRLVLQDQDALLTVHAKRTLYDPRTTSGSVMSSFEADMLAGALERHCGQRYPIVVGEIQTLRAALVSATLHNQLPTLAFVKAMSKSPVLLAVLEKLRDDGSLPPPPEDGVAGACLRGGTKSPDPDDIPPVGVVDGAAGGRKGSKGKRTSDSQAPNGTPAAAPAAAAGSGGAKPGIAIHRRPGAASEASGDGASGGVATSTSAGLDLTSVRFKADEAVNQERLHDHPPEHEEPVWYLRNGAVFCETARFGPVIVEM